ncbi:MAG: diaminopimelate epimerase, partial [Calditrichaeota bacterium]|nr:diaminopimelate epimerase [Calditrichota bacterium]
GLGRTYRQHAAFAPRGTNVDFVQVVDKHNVRMRTYERGVEDETLACGTGAVASAIIAHLCRGCQSPLQVQVRGGLLRVAFDRGFRHITLSGEVDPIFEGYIDAPA